MRVRATESESMSGEIGGMTCCWWVRFGTRLDTANIEGYWEEVGKGKDR